MDRWDRMGSPFALLVDQDHDAAKLIRPWLLSQGMELVHARAAFAALELLQRMPQNFVLVLVSLTLPDIPGAVLVETLRHFRPDLPAICLDGEDPSELYDISPCLTHPIEETEFQNQVTAAMGGVQGPRSLMSVDPEALERARVHYAIRGNLLEAAREIARGVTDEKT
jgi:DNA-binding response OmpR family regulator